MALNKVYTRINWEDYPSENTDLDAYHLNQMDSAIDALDNRIISQDALKLDKSAINGNIADWTMDETTGVITITKYNGEKVIFDLNIEKIPVGFSMSDDGIITMTTEDGTQFTADIGSMIPVLTFDDSDTIAVNVTGTGKNKTYSFSIKTGSVTGDMLQPNYLADVTVQAGKAFSSASDAANSAKAAKTSETNAKASETAAKNSETNSAANAKTATSNATSASTSATNAANSAKAAKTSETNAKASETAAKNSATNAKTSETNALSSKNSASTSASTAKTNANLSKSYAVGGTGTREGEDVDNAKYYMEQAKKQAGGIPTKVSELENDSGYITNSASDLKNYYSKTQTDNKLSSYLTKTGNGSNLTETFTQAATLTNISSGETHSVIFGKVMKAIADFITHKSTVATSSVLGHVKVDTSLSSTSTNPIQNKIVNTALAGKISTNGDASNVTTAFTEATNMEELISGEKLSESMGKLKLAVKNIKKLITLIGNTDISSIGNGTVTGAISDVNGKLIVPDYANAKLLDNTLQTNSFDFTAPQNGILLAGGYGSNQNNSYIMFRYSANRSIQFEIQGSSNEFIGALFPVAKGDVIEIITSLATKNNGTYFIPSK